MRERNPAYIFPKASQRLVSSTTVGSVEMSEMVEIPKGRTIEDDMKMDLDDIANGN